MTDPKPVIPQKRVMATATIASLLVAALLLGARFAGIMPAANEMSPLGAILLCAAFTVFISGGSAWYLARTDEHDRNANLWAMAWGWIAASVVTLNWVVLHLAGLVVAPQPIIILLASSAVVLAVWLWLRFR